MSECESPICLALIIYKNHLFQNLLFNVPSVSMSSPISSYKKSTEEVYSSQIWLLNEWMYVDICLNEMTCGREFPFVVQILTLAFKPS